jgi:hypothetical protein
MSTTPDTSTKTEAQRHAMDAAEIALRVGVSADFVRRVLRGKRRNDTVKQAYDALLAERAAAQAQFQKGTEQCG